MILLLRIIVIVLFAYFVYMVYQWLTSSYSKNVVCPHCDGEGEWETVREKETCILCKGAGVIEREE